MKSILSKIYNKIPFKLYILHFSGMELVCTAHDR